MRVVYLVWLLAILAAPCAFANCYVIQNNSKFAQRVDVHYNGPVNNEPVTIPLAPHDRYPKQDSSCWTDGASANISIEPGKYTLHFNGKPWSAPIVFGDGSNVTPSGTFTLDPT
jgi:hypothetical protein